MTTADAADLKSRCSRDDLRAGRANAEPAAGTRRMTPEEEEAADLARIRRALYDA